MFGMKSFSKYGATGVGKTMKEAKADWEQQVCNAVEASKCDPYILKVGDHVAVIAYHGGGQVGYGRARPEAPDGCYRVTCLMGGNDETAARFVRKEIAMETGRPELAHPDDRDAVARYMYETAGTE